MASSIGIQDKCLDSFSDVINILPHLHGWKAHLLLWAVVEFFVIQNQSLFFPFLFHPLIKTLLGLLAQPLVLDHLLDKRREYEIFSFLSCRQALIKILGNMSHDIQSNEISELEGG